ncbi:hypothetical protein [Planctomicrobium sp. SH527]|uniref:hypothetical protein n=1 Tax=Planctomicrobium sp. SH527 TaxID=3448123 RepID=UPI003F5C25F1
MHCGTEESAQALCERLRQILDAIPQDRAQLIEQQMRAAFDISALDQEYRRFRKWTLPLQWACSLWAMWTLTTILLLNFWPAQRYSGNVLLIGISGFLVLWFFTAATLIRANRQLRILQGREWNHTLCRLLLVPMAAMRSPNWFSRHVLQDFDPLVIAAYFCSDDVFFRLAQRRLLSLQSPTAEERPGEENARASQVFLDSRARMLTVVQELITQRGISVSELLEPPLRDPDAESYCPRCRGQYVSGVRTCPQCTGISLQPFG